MRLLSLADLRDKKGIGLTKWQINRLIKAGRFPQPIRLGGPNGQYRTWAESEIDAHLERLLAERTGSMEAA